MNEEEYLRNYHKRSNIETVFSTVKRKYSENLTSKNTTGQDNEIIAKFICHNLSCLNLTMYELGIEPTEYFQDVKDFGMPNVFEGIH